MWKRIAAVTVVALTVLLAGPMPSQAADPACPYVLPELPDECPSKAVYDLVAQMRNQNDFLAERNAELVADVNAARAEVFDLRTQVLLANQARDAALVNLHAAQAALVPVQALAATRLATVLRLRARLQELRYVLNHPLHV